ncbi:MAG: site-specific DNA-methyltransferase [Muribaculaceae bacterium]
MFYEEKKAFGSVDNSWFSAERVGTATNGTKELMKIFDGAKYFDTPKPVTLLSKLLFLGNLIDGDIVLDFFSGSATTAHAVMKLNAEDGGKRKFIMVQLPEVTDEKSEARKAGYENICQIGEERIRRAGRKILESMRRDMPSASGKGDGLFANETSQSDVPTKSDVPTLDVGFRVLKLDSSNMEDVYYTPEDFSEQNLFNSVDNVKSDRTPLDLLFQVMPELNIELSAKIEEKEVNGKKVFFVDGTYLIATFDTDVNESTVTELAKMKPQYFVMRDSSAANDNVLDNFDQIFRHCSPDTIRKMI